MHNKEVQKWSKIMRKKVSTDKAPAAIGPYSQGIIAGNVLYASGQIPIDPAVGNIKGEGNRRSCSVVYILLSE